MRRTRFGLGFVASTAGLTLGCQSVEHDTRVPQVTEFNVAPSETRYDQPRELTYRKPAPKKKFEPGLAPQGSPGMGGSGMGGR